MLSNMLKGILNSIKDVKFGFYSNSLIEDFEPIIPLTEVYLIYSIKEGNNVYTIVFYSSDAIYKNEDFDADRDDCFIDDRPDYLEAIQQSPAFYVVIYKKNKPVASVWFVANEKYNNVILLNPHGRPRNLSKFFGNPGDFVKGDYRRLENVLSVRVDNALVTTRDYSQFAYTLFCPNCHAYVKSDELVEAYDIYEDDYRLRCPHCSEITSNNIQWLNTLTV